jgi:hypothetical protein
VGITGEEGVRVVRGGCGPIPVRVPTLECVADCLQQCTAPKPVHATHHHPHTAAV